jgi:Flp pilus assembly protein TadG
VLKWNAAAASEKTLAEFRTFIKEDPLMLRGYARSFLTDEAGGGTIMGLVWFMLLVGITGLAVDTTDGFRNRTMLQATADASALAAAIDLPDAGAAVLTAQTYAETNLGVDTNGHVLNANDVHVGLWDQATKSLDTGATFPDAVMVTVNRSAANDNAVPVNFLRIIGLQTWNVTSQAVAQRFIPDCLRDGLIARQMVDISSNNGFVRNICVHGEEGVNIQSNNFFQSGVNVSMPSLDMLELPASGMESNPGLPEALRENHLDPRMVDHIDEIIDILLNPSVETDLVGVIPSYIDLDLPVMEVDNKVDFTALNFAPGSGRIYEIDCRGNPTVTVPEGITLSNVVIVIECSLIVAPGTTLTNVVLASYMVGNGQNALDLTNISIAANVQLGGPDNCTPGGGVQIFSPASVKIASSAAIDGVQIVAANDIELGARDMGINGISAQAGGDITLTSNNMFGLCSGGAPDLFTVPYYRLVL